MRCYRCRYNDIRKLFSYYSGSCESVIDSIGWDSPEKTFSSLVRSLEDLGFVLNSEKKDIYDVKSIGVMKEVVGAEGWVINILKSGVQLDFNQMLPSNYSERNNLSAVKEMSFLRDKVDSWISEGFVQRVSLKPQYVNPMSVVVKTDLLSNTVKKRPVIDMSRCINNKLRKTPFKMDHLSVIEPSLQKNDFQVVFDLENMYFHFKLAPEHRHYFSFSLPDENGELMYFEFLVMCYGYALAAYIVTRVIVPIKAFLHRLGIRFSIFIDDGRILAQSKSDCEFKAKFALHMFQLCGFNIQWKKTNLDPSQIVLYQGVITDTVAMRYFISTEKFHLIHAVLTEIIFKSKEKFLFPARELASLLGKIHSLSRSHGSIVSIMTRNLQHLVGKTVVLEGWSSFVQLDEHCIRELSFLADNLIQFNGKLIPVSKTADRTVTHKEIDTILKQICYSDTNVPNLIVSDASDKHAFVYKADEFVQVCDFEFDDVETDLSSGHRELLAVLKFLQDCKDKRVHFKSTLIYWQTDSKNNFIFLSRGSRKPYIQSDIVSIKFLEKDLGITIIPVWTPRNHSRIILADLGSKFSLSSDEWGIDRLQLLSIFNLFAVSPDVDCFASEVNSRCKTFYSKIPQNGSSGINFFSQSLVPNRVYFCCPPVKEIENTIKHLLHFEGILSLLIIPFWPSAHFWPLLSSGQKFIPEVIDYSIFDPTFMVFNQCDSIFSRKPTFKMIALKLIS